ncbi:FtsW/RodA/SpoVE family cell cycle protein [Luedemannella flava]
MTDWLTGPAGTNVPVLTGMVVTAVLCWRLLARPVFVDARHDGAGPVARAAAPFVLAQVLVAAGFWLSRSTDTIWIMLVLAAIVGLTAVSLAVLGRAARRAGTVLSGPTVAVVLLTALLNEIGALLLVRLVIVSDPDSPFGAGLAADAWLQARDAVGYPLVVAAAALAVAWFATGTGTGRGAVARVRRSLDGRVARWRARRGGLPEVTGRTITGGALVALALFIAPVFGPTTGSAHLTILGVATPQVGLIVLIAVLAALVARYGHRFNATGRVDIIGFGRRLARGLVSRGEARVMWVDLRHMLLPVGLFVAVAATCAVRRDFGTVIPALAATFGVTWAATSDSVRRSPDLTEDGTFSPATVWRRLTRSLSVYRVFIWAALVLVGTAGTVVVLGTSYIQERATVWADPWAYRWDAGCAVPGARSRRRRGDLLPAVAGREPGEPALAGRPGAVGRRRRRAVGAGLRDTASGMVPAGQTDFILAVVWNKLGGVAVLLISVLVVMLGAALRQAARSGRARAPDGRAGRRQGQLWFGFFTAGLASMIVGNYLFVFLATVNVIPHSGIPAPFLSRGGQWTLALLAGIAVVVVIASRTGLATAASRVPSARPVQAPTMARPGRLAVVVPLTVCLACAAVITVVPYQKPGLPLPTAYDETRPACRVREATHDGPLRAAGPGALLDGPVGVRPHPGGGPPRRRDRAGPGPGHGGLDVRGHSAGGADAGRPERPAQGRRRRRRAARPVVRRRDAGDRRDDARQAAGRAVGGSRGRRRAGPDDRPGTAARPRRRAALGRHGRRAADGRRRRGHRGRHGTGPRLRHRARLRRTRRRRCRGRKGHRRGRAVPQGTPVLRAAGGERLDGSVKDTTCEDAADSGEPDPDCWRWSVIIPGAPGDADGLAALRRYVGGGRDVDLPCRR